VLADSTGSEQLLAREPARIIRCEKPSDGGDVAHQPGASQWRLRNQILLQVRAQYASAAHPFGLDHTGVDRVDADLLRPEFAHDSLVRII
jgi:hypothetical protein